MAGHGSKKVIYAAAVGNGLIAVTKFIAASITGSSAMFSEAIHSLVDTGNQGLLLFGMARAKKPADDDHPFGHGMELYFWTFVVAILIFAVGAGISIYEGVHKLLDPHPVTNPMINYIVLGLAIVFEGFAWWVAYKEFNRTRGKMGLFMAIRRSKDPTVFTVLFEDSAAMLGLIVAFVGIFIGQVTGIPHFDGVASVIIGLILAITAVLLAYESRGLLIGEAAQPEVVDGIREILKAEKSVARINELRTMHMGPEEVLLTVSVDFVKDMSADEVEASVSRFELAIKSRYPLVRRVFIEAQSWRAHKADAHKSEPGLDAGNGAFAE